MGERAGCRLDVLAQQRLKLRARDGTAPQALQVACGELAIDDGNPIAPADIYQVGQRDFGRIPLSAEHGLTEENASQPHTVQATYQHIVAICLEAMGVSQSVQVNVGIAHLRGNPRAQAVWTWSGTVVDDAGEVAINLNQEAAIADCFTQAP